jgi:hypothetical protein
VCFRETIEIISYRAYRDESGCGLCPADVLCVKPEHTKEELVPGMPHMRERDAVGSPQG